MLRPWTYIIAFYPPLTDSHHLQSMLDLNQSSLQERSGGSAGLRVALLDVQIYILLANPTDHAAYGLF